MNYALFGGRLSKNVDALQGRTVTREGEMDKTYAVRAGQRISIRCPFLYHGETFHGKGHLWDLSASDWRATGDQPVTPGMSMPVYLELAMVESPSIY